VNGLEVYTKIVVWMVGRGKPQAANCMLIRCSAGDFGSAGRGARPIAAQCSPLGTPASGLIAAP
jgi:hypothetical protein